MEKNNVIVDLASVEELEPKIAPDSGMWDTVE